jgi:quinol-cytochrome oxidoreductase complex cytochrome b subunit
MKGNDFVERVRTAIDQRLPLEEMRLGALMSHKEVPQHRMSWAYYMGGFTLFFFMVQVVTGLMLLFYYKPTTARRTPRWNISPTRSPRARWCATCIPGLPPS